MASNGHDLGEWGEETKAQVEDRWLSHLIETAVKKSSAHVIRRLSIIVLLGTLALAAAIGALAWSLSA